MNENTAENQIMFERKKLIADTVALLDMILPKRIGPKTNETNPDVNLLRIPAEKCALLTIAELDEMQRKAILAKGMGLVELYRSGLGKVNLSEQDKMELESRLNSITTEDLNFPENIVKKLKIDTLDDIDSMQNFRHALLEAISKSSPAVKEAAGFMSVLNY